MASGHIGLDILTSTHIPFVELNKGRYGDLNVADASAIEF